MARVWMFDPQAGGRKVPPATQEIVRRRILDHAARGYAGTYARIEVRFKGAFCYIDAYTEPTDDEHYPTASLGESRAEYVERMRNTPMHLCRLRHFDTDRWSVAFFAYSSERYEPCIFPTGEWIGTPEEAFDIGAVYLQ